MRYALFVILLLTAPRGVVALTWDFDDGSTYGWTARATTFYIDTPLHSEVVDGVWRMALVPNQIPNVDLIPPVIGEDSALFDRLTLRLRLIHHSPIEGFFQMYWSNVKYNRRTDFNVDRARFHEARPQRYPTEWEDITVDLRALAEADLATWQDTLFKFDIQLKLYEDYLIRHPQYVDDDYPTFLEIDRIQLIGAEELAQGELSPRDIAVEVGPPGTLFAAPDFFSLGGPIKQLHGGAVGDIDGDGDADIAVGWHRNVDRKAQVGWSMASNDGLGGFEHTQEILLPTKPSNDYPLFMDLRGSDFDGDGLLDLVVHNGRTVEVWYNWGDEFDPILQLSNVSPLGTIGLADGDGDGDVDLLVWGRDGESYYVTLWINDGYSFVSSDRFVFDSEEVSPFLPAGQPLGEAAVLVWRQLCGRRLCNPQFWQLTRPWAAVQEPPLAVEVPFYPYARPLLADFDGDGTVDLLGSLERIEMPSFDSNNYGLALWLLNASGGWTRHSLLNWKTLSSHIATADLNGDGLLDIAMVAGNLPVGPALMVWLGQPNDIPAFEGYYPLPGEGSQVLTGDVNGDGDTDLVVLGKSPGSDHGGVFVFKNQGTPATAVANETVVTPTAFSLGANYPNPFNPTTTILLAVPAGARNVELTIYNMLGQPMRQVWNGPLAAGEHELTWDGRDAQGLPVATGIYVYRVQVDERTHARKMVKLE